MHAERFHPFDYLHFARYEMQGAPHVLCMSGVPEVTAADLRLTAPPRLGMSAVREVRAAFAERVAARWGVPAANVRATHGASAGAQLAVAALVSLERDRTGTAPLVAIERPAYGVFEAAARLVGARVEHVDRRFAEGYRLDPARVEAALADGARIVCLTNLQNPTGVLLADDELAAVTALAARHGAWIVLDEVYRDFLPGPVGTAYREGARVVCVSSLTKCYGAGGLRAGFLVADPEVLDRADAIYEITHGDDSVPALDLAAAALDVADALLERGRDVARRGRRVMDAWIDATPGVSWVPPAAGITGLVHVAGLADSRHLARRLREDLGVQVVPGLFFGAHDALRISFGLPPAQLSRALETLALGLGALLRNAGS